jgi:hypothetical protein
MSLRGRDELLGSSSDLETYWLCSCTNPYPLCLNFLICKMGITVPTWKSVVRFKWIIKALGRETHVCAT